jgi:ribosomal protein L44E
MTVRGLAAARIEPRGVQPVKSKLWLVAATFQWWNRSLERATPNDAGSSMPDKEAKGLDLDPQCVKCSSKMRFSCTEPDKPGFVHLVYECTKCRSTQSFVTPL